MNLTESLERNHLLHKHAKILFGFEKLNMTERLPGKSWKMKYSVWVMKKTWHRVKYTAYITRVFLTNHHYETYVLQYKAHMVCYFAFHQFKMAQKPKKPCSTRTVKPKSLPSLNQSYFVFPSVRL